MRPVRPARIVSIGSPAELSDRKGEMIFELSSLSSSTSKITNEDWSSRVTCESLAIVSL
jgi:hypothetical protein